MAQVNYETSIQYLKGVGEKRAALYRKLGIQTIGDLLGYYPRTYLDFSHPYTIQEAPNGETCAVRAIVLKKGNEQRIRRGLSVFKVVVTDQVTDMAITFFNTKYLVDSLKIGEEYLFYGKISATLVRHEMASPMVFPARTDSLFSPVYSLTQGLSNKMISQNVKTALSLTAEETQDALPSPLRERYQLCHRRFAWQNIHFPKDAAALEVARRRLIFEELFLLAIGFSQVKSQTISHRGVPMKPVSLSAYYQALPYRLTGAQLRVIDEACRDMARGTTPMNRLIQGDVGSGKTAVAAACAYFAFQNGCQSVLMAPTEILAEQHYTTLSQLLEPLGMKIGILTGSMTAKEKRHCLGQLSDGQINFIVGTHALLEDSVAFSRLGLVITDEQHRFGVAQRITLAQKGENPHVMVMSATPIPRTLAYIIYGDLDISIIDELPKNRLPIKTYLISNDKLQRAYGFVRRHLDEGRQGYIVCPLVQAAQEGEDAQDLKAAVDYAQALSETVFQGYRVGCLHGKMKAGEKESVMARFQSGEIQLLVSTTVVEVGVDVPNAVIMMIENADRFGLSQLHQLRGRVGRGAHQSYCILVSNTHNPQTIQRLKVICSSNDGFKISEQDLKLRGPGDFFGYRQHGLPALKIADMLTDVKLLDLAQGAARELLEDDPQLKRPEHQLLGTEVKKLLATSAG